MEQRHKIRLTTSNTFDLEREEIKRLYIYLSLFMYHYLRNPDYQEKGLIEQLTKDFKNYHKEMLAQTERDPNNLMLNKIKVFFDLHYKKLKEKNDEYKETSLMG
ncbi:MAG: hypothetical protein SNH13_05400 [Rikenellaceae bacterium]